MPEGGLSSFSFAKLNTSATNAGRLFACRPCTKCPTGVDCSSGTEEPWKAFVPKLLKIGDRIIERATIKGITSDFQVDALESYELQFDVYTEEAQLALSATVQASDYVWEWVVECTDENQPCEPHHVPTFFLRQCPNGTQLINYTFGSYAFEPQAQQCAPCGPLKYIVDPAFGGTCQACPKGADCPDGDLFVSKATGSEWEIHYAGPRNLDVVYRVKTCPPGFFMTRKEEYPLEDECTICEAGTYLLDQSNFSACLNCAMGAICKGGNHIEASDGFWMEPANFVHFATVNKSRARRQEELLGDVRNVTDRRPRTAKLHRCPAGVHAEPHRLISHFLVPLLHV